MPSQTDIYNSALISVGSSPISSPSDDTKSARALNAVYDMDRQALLRDHPWNFAKKQVALAALDSTTVPLFGYTNAFAIPADCLRILEVSQEVTTHKLFNYGGAMYLFTNDTVASVSYISDVTDTEIFDPMFTKCLSYMLAAHVGYSLSANDKLVSMCESKYEMWYRKAKLRDAQEESQDQFTDGTLVENHY